jgi:hypothetical protein
MARQHRKTLIVIVLSYLIALTADSSAEPGKSAGSQYTPVSMVRLIADPEKYDGKRVTVAGIFAVATEEQSLYLSPADADGENGLNALQLVFGDQAEQYRSRAHELNFKWVSIEGTFDMYAKAFWGRPAPSGGLRDIRNIVLMSHQATRTEAYARGFRLVPPSVIPDEQTACEIARSIWTPLYGHAEVVKSEPIQAELRDGIWTVAGQIVKGQPSASHLVAWIRQSNGELVGTMPRNWPSSSSPKEREDGE